VQAILSLRGYLSDLRGNSFLSFAQPESDGIDLDRIPWQLGYCEVELTHYSGAELDDVLQLN
jgi:hypothetical protein